MSRIQSERILYGSHPPQSLIEEYEFSISNPYFVRVKQPSADDFALPHYSKETIEILLCTNVEGDISIDQMRYNICRQTDCVFVIPPDTIHSTHFQSGGTIIVLQISLPNMSQIVNIPLILDRVDLYISDLVNSFPKYDRIYPLIMQLIENDGNLFMCYKAIISIVQVLCGSIEEGKTQVNVFNEHSNAELKKVISWTNENYNKQISIETLAKLVGMSRTYFCSWFKSKTNMTCTQYLNQVRIANAVKLLAAGKSVGAVALDCGFANTSYFISVFKKLRGCTPKEFAMKYFMNTQ